MVVIALALLVVAVACVVYLRPFTASPRPRVLAGAPASPTPPQLDGRFAATYDFVTPTLGWALVTQNATDAPQFWVFRTGDGARHWAQQFAGRCAGTGASNVTMFDRSHGEIDLCEPLLLYRTADGGASWKPGGLPPYSYAMVTFGDFAHGWYLALPVGPAAPVQRANSLVFLGTSDGGLTWVRLPALPRPSTPVAKGGSFNLQFRGAATGWMGSEDFPATVYATADGGLSWRPMGLPVPAVPIDQGGFFDTQVKLLPGTGVLAWATDASGSSQGFTSYDAGLTWHELGLPPGNTDFGSYAFVDATHWWAMKNSTLYKSSDGGRSWQFATLLLDAWDYSIHPLDSKHAWAQLSGGLANFVPSGGAPDAGLLAPGSGLAMTADGGLHWTYLAVPQPHLS